MEYDGKLLQVIDSCTADFEIELGFRIIVTKRLKLWGLLPAKDKAKQKMAKNLIKQSLNKLTVSVHLEGSAVPHQEPYLASISFEETTPGVERSKTVFLNDRLLEKGLVTEYTS